MSKFQELLESIDSTDYEGGSVNRLRNDLTSLVEELRREVIERPECADSCRAPASPEEASADPPHPMQPVVLVPGGAGGVARFKENAIVTFLYETSHARGCGMNQLMLMPFNREDREQFAQLIGYSVSGFAELSYVSDEAARRAAEAREVLAKESGS
jgi:hypothetical protein